METKRESSVLGDRDCSFEGYDATLLMNETAKLRKLITKRGMVEILISLCCNINLVRYMKLKRL